MQYATLKTILTTVLFFILSILISIETAHGMGRTPKRVPPRNETSTGEKPAHGGLKSYTSAVAGAQRVDSGYIVVHQLKEDWLFEVPLGLQGRDILIVNKVSGVGGTLNETAINRGIHYRTMLVRLVHQAEGHRLLLEEQDPRPECPESNALYPSVRANYLGSLIASLPIVAYNADSTAAVVSVKSLFNGEESTVQNLFGIAGLGGSPMGALSGITGMKAFDSNILARSRLTTRIPGAEEKAHITVEVTSNWALLPEKRMVPRFADPRVGVFHEPKLYFFDTAQRAIPRRIITRWRLEPKPQDQEAYLRGDLVEPAQPIIFYIDSCTPPQWVPYLKRGIEAWNEAFEQAGFKGAIKALDMPSGNPTFDLDDIRYSSVTYAASEVANAMGPSVIDPRTGEILEADIMWWHNVMGGVHRWLRVQVPQIDTLFMQGKLPEHLMGKALEFVVTHEVGHSLGLMHNMAGSFAYSVDSLRSPAFTQKHGTTASIMDYARFNYVAQPEDGVKVYWPMIGEYDRYAIEFMYRWHGAANPFEEEKTQREFVDRHANNPLYYFGAQADGRGLIDPRSQGEALGDDPVRAGELGMKNLQWLMGRMDPIVKQLPPDEAGKYLHDIIDQWHQYAYHALANIGGVYLNDRELKNGQAFTPVPADRQRASLNFLREHVIQYPAWLFDHPILRYVYPVKSSPMGPYEYAPMELFSNYQGYILWDLLEDERMARLVEAESRPENRGGQGCYHATDLLDDLHQALFGKTERSGTALTLHERIAQRNYIDALIISADRGSARKERKALMAPDGEGENAWLTRENICRGTLNEARGFESAERRVKYYQLSRVSDVLPLKRGALLRAAAALRKRQQVEDPTTRYHYNDLLLRVEDALGLTTNR